MRTSSELDCFPLPFSELVKTFPVPPKEQQRRSVDYTQCLDDGLTLKFESLYYRTTVPIAQIKRTVEDWLQAHSIACVFSTSALTNDSGIIVSDLFSWKTDEFLVDIDMEYEHRDKTISVHATFFRRPGF